jgi:hypothetical protein
MFQKFRADEVVRPFRNLNHLTDFAFPQNTDFGVAQAIDDIPWPPNLQRVSLSGRFDASCPLFSAKGVVQNWPLSLRQIVLDGAKGIRRLYDDPRVFLNSPYNLDSVYVSDRNEFYGRFQNLALSCSGARLLSLPANFAVTNHNSYGFPPVFERLEIRRQNDVGPHRFLLSDLVKHAVEIPALQQIRVHSSLVEIKDKDPALRLADAVLRNRGPVRALENEKSRITSNAAGVMVYSD